MYDNHASRLKRNSSFVEMNFEMNSHFPLSQQTSNGTIYTYVINGTILFFKRWSRFYTIISLLYIKEKELYL